MAVQLILADVSTHYSSMAVQLILADGSTHYSPMAVQLILADGSTHYSSITCNGLCSYLHSELFLHCHTASQFVITVR